jgi:hypothetical protein
MVDTKRDMLKSLGRVGRNQTPKLIPTINSSI